MQSPGQAILIRVARMGPVVILRWHLNQYYVNIKHVCIPGGPLGPVISGVLALNLSVRLLYLLGSVGNTKNNLCIYALSTLSV